MAMFVRTFQLDNTVPMSDAQSGEVLFDLRR